MPCARTWLVVTTDDFSICPNLTHSGRSPTPYPFRMGAGMNDRAMTKAPLDRRPSSKKWGNLKNNFSICIKARPDQ
jgi:hypothetical protein